MRGQRGWRELAVLGDKINKFTGMIEGLIWSPRSGEGSAQVDEWAFEEVITYLRILNIMMNKNTILRCSINTVYIFFY